MERWINQTFERRALENFRRKRASIILWCKSFGRRHLHIGCIPIFCKQGLIFKVLIYDHHSITPMQYIFTFSPLYMLCNATIRQLAPTGAFYVNPFKITYIFNLLLTLIKTLHVGLHCVCVSVFVLSSHCKGRRGNGVPYRSLSPVFL